MAMRGWWATTPTSARPGPARRLHGRGRPHLHLQVAQGHLWSDGTPFTTEDLRFFWEDIALDPKLSSTGPPIQMLVDGEPPRSRCWTSAPSAIPGQAQPMILPAIAEASPLDIYRPARYLRQFLPKYAEPATLEQLVKETRSRDWVQLFLRKDRLDESDNPTCRRSSPGCRPPGRRPTASPPCATPISTASTRRPAAPISTG
ncbi:MAG: hypothetical protein U1E17_06585 [Geminicoccaceae bacterium]